METVQQERKRVIAAYQKREMLYYQTLINYLAPFNIIKNIFNNILRNNYSNI